MISISFQVNGDKLLPKAFVKVGGVDYLQLALWRSQEHQYGNHWMVVQDVPRAMREAGEKGKILGTGRDVRARHLYKSITVMLPLTPAFKARLSVDERKRAWARVSLIPATPEQQAERTCDYVAKFTPTREEQVLGTKTAECGIANKRMDLSDEERAHQLRLLGEMGGAAGTRATAASHGGDSPEAKEQGGGGGIADEEDENIPF